MRSTSTLRRRLLARDARVAVVGQGYVGLSLACAAAEAGFEVTGIDVDADRVDALAAGRLVVPGVDEATFQGGVATGRLRFSADGDALATSDVICICVPTPVRDTTPDLSYVEQACRDVAQRLVGRVVADRGGHADADHVGGRQAVRVGGEAQTTGGHAAPEGGLVHARDHQLARG